jgi:hypothetical protein
MKQRWNTVQYFGNKVHTVTYSVTLDAPYDITNSKSANDEQQFIFYGGCFTGNLLMPTTKNKELSEACSFVCNNK